MTITLKGADTKITVDGTEFTLRPQLWTDRAEVVDRLDKMGYTSERVMKSTMMYLITLKCITSWNPPPEDQDGNPLECNDQNKMLLYDQKPTLLDQIMEEFYDIKLSAEKNLETTQDG